MQIELGIVCLFKCWYNLVGLRENLKKESLLVSSYSTSTSTSTMFSKWIQTNMHEHEHEPFSNKGAYIHSIHMPRNTYFGFGAKWMFAFEICVQSVENRMCALSVKVQPHSILQFHLIDQQRAIYIYIHVQKVRLRIRFIDKTNTIVNNNDGLFCSLVIASIQIRVRIQKLYAFVLFPLGPTLCLADFLIHTSHRRWLMCTLCVNNNNT